VIDPSGLVYRQALRQAQKDRYQNNGRGQKLASLRGFTGSLRLQAALHRGKYVAALELGEELLTRNPWNISAQLDLAEALEELNLLDQALWTIDQARKLAPTNVRVNRRLAQLLEKLGNFAQAIKLWEMVRKADPNDLVAAHKVNDLAASDTIARGNFGEMFADESRPQSNVTNDGESEREDDEAAVANTPSTPADERGARDIVALEGKIKAHPKVAGNYLHAAGIHRRNEQFDKARAVLQQGLALTGNNFELAQELADLDIEPFRHNLAITEEKLKNFPADSDLQKIRAKLRKEINTRELDLFRQKSERFPTELVHHFEMGVRLLNLDQVDESIKELQSARNDPRHRSKALYYLGFCFKQRNNWRLAQRNFEEALQNLPAGDTTMRFELLYQLAVGLAEAGDIERAFELGCELANLDYAYRDIGDLVEKWQKRIDKG
jgi:tetratricopeptide (TPR) repeat protein